MREIRFWQFYEAYQKVAGPGPVNYTGKYITEWKELLRLIKCTIDFL